MFPAPSAAPNSVSVSAVTTSSITVQWGTVDCIHRNGDITGYLVRYGLESDGRNRKTEDASEEVYSITGLNHSTIYVIQVAAVNLAGGRVYSDPLVITTRGNISKSKKSRLSNLDAPLTDGSILIIVQCSNKYGI